MQKILNFIKNNKVMGFIVFLFISIIYIIVSNFRADYINYSIIESSTENPYLLVTKGSAIIKRDTIVSLKENEKKVLEINDKIRTFDESSATVFWPDGSITRMGSKSAITISEMSASKDLSNIKIKFNIEQGKTWSNIVKFMTKNSYFTETYDFGNYAATVRGTVFEINLDDNYIHAVNHDVSLIDIKNDESYNVQQGLGRNLSSPKDTTPSEIFNQVWIAENLKLDNEFLKELLEKWQKQVNEAIAKQTIGTNIVTYIKIKLGNKDYLMADVSKSIVEGGGNTLEKIKNIIPELSPEDKLILNEKLSSTYQNIHSLPNSDELALYKSKLRDLIINTSPNDVKTKLTNDFIKLDIYDYIDVSKNKGSKVAGELKSGIVNYLDQMQDPKELEALFSSFGENMLNVINSTFGKVNTDMKEIITNLKEQLSTK
ncbi:MAG: FecR domain-containing protein [Candidatus Gracilibacteria bacterium]|nr:FecR domain-containing protein [Candidatus Gracilibacteria bacterium]MDD2909014.1 FecR domain-containing protein [Candidatus Gracilibacteria bacterium]